MALAWMICVCAPWPVALRPSCLISLDTSPNALKLRPRLTDGALAAMLAHSWPGNVRELFNRLERAVLLAEDGVLTERHVLQSSGLPPPASGPLLPDGDVTLDDLEHRYIAMLLEREQGNVTEVSRIIGVDPTTIRRKLRKWESGR